jgi:predicted nucleic acid-binding protein
VSGFLLDTNVISEFKRRGEPDALVRSWLRRTDPDLLWASVLSFGEILKGIERLPAGKRRTELEDWVRNELEGWFDQRLLPVTKPIAELWGILSARGLGEGREPNVIDGLLAATAIHNQLMIVTRNTKHFVSLGVAILNPWDG